MPPPALMTDARAATYAIPGDVREQAGRQGLAERVKKKAVIICRPIPHMMSTGGHERMVLECQRHIFRDYDVYLLIWDGRSRMELLHRGVAIPPERVAAELDPEELAFAFFFCPGSA